MQKSRKKSVKNVKKKEFERSDFCPFLKYLFSCDIALDSVQQGTILLAPYFKFRGCPLSLTTWDVGGRGQGPLQKYFYFYGERPCPKSMSSFFWSIERFPFQLHIRRLKYFKDFWTCSLFKIMGLSMKMIRFSCNGTSCMWK